MPFDVDKLVNPWFSWLHRVDKGVADKQELIDLLNGDVPIPTEARSVLAKILAGDITCSRGLKSKALIKSRALIEKISAVYRNKEALRNMVKIDFKQPFRGGETPRTMLLKAIGNIYGPVKGQLNRWKTDVEEMEQKPRLKSGIPASDEHLESAAYRMAEVDKRLSDLHDRMESNSITPHDEQYNDLATARITELATQISEYDGAVTTLPEETQKSPTFLARRKKLTEAEAEAEADMER